MLFISLIAVIVSGFALTFIYTLKMQQDDAVLIHTAGQQRMLSQRIALSVIRLSQCPIGKYVVKELQKSLEISTNQFEKNKTQIANSPDLSATISNYYFGKIALAAKSDLYVENANKFLDSANFCGPVPTSFNVSNTEALLAELEQVVLFFEREARQRLQSLENIEILLWFLTLVILACEVLFIFLPMEKKIHQTNTSLNTVLRKARRTKRETTKQNKEQSEVIANLSCELSTYINYSLDTMASSIVNPSDSSEHLKKSKSVGQKLLVLINDLLDLSTIEVGTLPIERTTFDLQQLFENVTREQRDNCHLKKLIFNYQKETNLPEYIFGDPLRIIQIINNLLINSIKFTRRGSVNLEVEVQNKHQRSWLIVKVWDTGVGIETGNSMLMFNKRKQTDYNSINLFGESGLSFFIARKLTNLMKGALTVDREVNKGSHFTLTLPIEIDNKKMKQANPHVQLLPQFNTPKSSNIIKILVVEDDEIQSEIVKIMLEGAGYQVVIAADGEQAIQACIFEQYDLILMDILMPILDGISTTIKLRKELNFLNPIIALTANALDEDRERCIREGMNDFLSKPIEKMYLLAVVAKHLN